MNPAPVACVFPGQGSQRKGMGAELFDRFPALCAAADEILGYSIRELCVEDPERNLRLTGFTQPALFVVDAFSWLARAEEKPPPDFLAGHSLGEYGALFAAGCFDFETGLRLVQRRGALMARVEDGGMAAVLGLDAERVVEVLRQQAAPVDVANYNLPTQLVLAGAKADLQSLIEPLEAAGARKCILLNVSGAFHSRYMATAAAELESFLEGFHFAAPRIEVIANTTAAPYAAGSVARHLADQMRSPVLWAQTMDTLRARGVKEIEELGPGKVLRKLWATAPPLPDASVATELGGAAPEANAAETLGDRAFRRDYGLRYAYVAGAPAAGVRAPELVINLARAGMLGFLDVPAEPPDAAGVALGEVARTLGPEGAFGVCLRAPAADAPPAAASREDRLVAGALEHGVRAAEAVGYHRVTPALARFRFAGARRDASGAVALRRLLVQVTRPSIAARFLGPAPQEIVAGLAARGELTAEEAEIARRLPVASDLCALTGGESAADLLTLLPALSRLRDQAPPSGSQRVRVGAGGALGTPEAIACAFFLGADFVQTGAVNMASVEAAVPSSIKRLLAGLEAGDTAAIPAAGGFMIGARARAVAKGTLFAARARKLEQLFRFHDSLEAIDPVERRELEATCFKRPLSAVWESLRDRHPAAGDDPKHKMALVFGWYLEQSQRWALGGDEAQRLNYQIPCDESMAAFNAFAAGTPLADLAGRSAAAIAEALMRGAAAFLARRQLSIAPGTTGLPALRCSAYGKPDRPRRGSRAT